jgi:DNA-binding NtrC family response regulator
MITERNILHIDDNPAMTRIVADRLRAHGYHLTALNDPMLVVETLVQGKFRVVLLDIDMPGLNGLQVLQKIKRLDGSIQVIMLTGLVSIKLLIDALKFGAEACFFKPLPIDLRPICSAIDDAFRKMERWTKALEELETHRNAITRLESTLSYSDPVLTR